MSTKALVYLIALITLLIYPCLGEYQTFSVWHYNVSLDLSGKSMTVETQPVTSDLDSTKHSMYFRGSSAADWGAIYLFDNRKPSSAVAPEDILRALMLPSCKAIWVNPGSISGNTGLIAKAEARVEHGFGQRCYGGIVQLSPTGPEEIILFAIIGHFTDESLNERFVKTAKIDYIGLPKS